MNQKKIFFILIVVLILFGIFARIISLNNDYTAEETEFTRSASAIKNTGHPIFYQSEQVPKELALWHPPMYIFFPVFSSTTERSPGCTLTPMYASTSTGEATLM